MSDDNWEDQPTLKQRQALSKAQVAKPFISGMVAVGVAGIASITIVAVTVPESAPTITGLITLVGVLLASIATLTKVSETTVRLDGRVDEALDATAKASYQVGLKEGINLGRTYAADKAATVADRVVKEKAIQKALGHEEGKAAGVEQERVEERQRQAGESGVLS